MFRNLLIADLASDIGTFMHGVAAAWLMVSQGAGPLFVALTQTALALPFFLLALPAGALGDIFDRRKLIVVGRRTRMNSWQRSRNSRACDGAMARRVGKFITIPKIRLITSKRLSSNRGQSICGNTRDSRRRTANWKNSSSVSGEAIQSEAFALRSEQGPNVGEI